MKQQTKAKILSGKQPAALNDTGEGHAGYRWARVSGPGMAVLSTKFPDFSRLPDLSTALLLPKFLPFGILTSKKRIMMPT
jgi:hypothetical protein